MGTTELPCPAFFFLFVLIVLWFCRVTTSLRRCDRVSRLCPQSLVISVRKDKGQRSGAGSYSCSGAPQVDDHMSYALMPVLSCPVYQLLYKGHAILTGEEAKSLSSFVDIRYVFQLRHICGLLPLPDSRTILHNLHSELNHADIPLVAPSLLYICVMLCHWAI